MGPEQEIADMRERLKTYRKPVVITTAVVLLQLAFGVDYKFFIINIIWLLFDDYGKKENTDSLHGK